MSTSFGVETLAESSALRIDVCDPIEVFLMVFDRVNAVEGEWGEERNANGRLAHGCHARRVLITQQVAAEARLGPLSVFELDNSRPLNGLLANAKQAGGNLRDDVILVRR